MSVHISNEVTNSYYDVDSGHAYNAHDRCIAAGYDNGDIKLFDLRNMALRWETNLQNGVSAIQVIFSTIVIISSTSTFFQDQSRVWTACFPTALGRQSTFSNILGPLVPISNKLLIDARTVASPMNGLHPLIKISASSSEMFVQRRGPYSQQ